MGSEETHPTPSVHEDIPAASAEEPAADDHEVAQEEEP